MRTSFWKLALSGLLLLPFSARADTFSFTLSGSGGGFNGAGVLTAGSNGDGSYTITGISGTGITGLLASNTFFTNDNLLFPGTARLLDVDGFAFTTLFAGVTASVNIFLNSTQTGYESFSVDSLGNYSDTPVAFTLAASAAATPEPPSILLFGCGLVAASAAVYRKQLAS